MGTFSIRRFVFSALIYIAAVSTVPPAQAQTELWRFLDAVDEARVQDQILFVYFHSSDLGHPRSFQELVPEEVAESITDRASHVDIDTAADGGHVLANAFFGFGGLLPEDRMHPILGIVPPEGKRAMTILGEGMGEIDPANWSRLWAQLSPGE